ncbi:MAG: hypothetical protein FWC56_01320 [Phycisphaerae bacterium]|nr:hypothetical protein [Phycisphaerae bacterium]
MSNEPHSGNSQSGSDSSQTIEPAVQIIQPAVQIIKPAVPAPEYLASERLLVKICGRFIVGCLLVAAIVVGVWFGVDYLRVHWACSQFSSMSSAQQRHWLQQAAKNRDSRFESAIKSSLEMATDHEVIASAGYAAMRIKAIDILPLIQKRADEFINDEGRRADLIVYAAKLAGRGDGTHDPLVQNVRDWLMQGTRSEESWRRTASAIGLLYAGRPEAGPLLIDIMRSSPPAVQEYAMRELALIARPLAETIGQPIAALENKTVLYDEVTLGQIEQFWKQYVTPQLFDDVLTRITSRDPDWAEIQRLIHARDRVARFIQ